MGGTTFTWYCRKHLDIEGLQVAPTHRQPHSSMVGTTHAPNRSNSPQGPPTRWPPPTPKPLDGLKDPQRSPGQSASMPTRGFAARFARQDLGHPRAAAAQSSGPRASPLPGPSASLGFAQVAPCAKSPGWPPGPCAPPVLRSDINPLCQAGRASTLRTGPGCGLRRPHVFAGGASGRTLLPNSHHSTPQPLLLRSPSAPITWLEGEAHQVHLLGRLLPAFT